MSIVWDNVLKIQHNFCNEHLITHRKGLTYQTDTKNTPLQTIINGQNTRNKIESIRRY